MRWTSAGFLAALLLTGCGGSEPSENGDAPGSAIEVSGTGMGAVAPPSNLPPFAPVYPGASVTTTTLNPQEQDKGMMVLAAPRADSAAVIAFYKQKAEAAGLKTGMETVTGAARIIMMTETGESGGDTERGLQVTAAPDEEGGSIVTVVYVGGQAGE